jgi:hypothetical protein
MNKYLDPNLYYEISEVISKFYPYSVEDIDNEIQTYKSVDIVLRGIRLALEQNISLYNACYLESLPK